MTRNLRFALIFALIAGLLYVVAYLTSSVWAECRADGHSRLYCSRLVAR